MITYQHVTTFGVTQPLWLSQVTDLAIVGSEGQYVLVAATHIGGGVTSYQISDPDTPLRQLGSRPYLQTYTYQGAPEISVIQLGDRVILHLAELGGVAARGAELAPVSGSIAGFAPLFPSGLPAGTITALEQVSTPQGEFVLLARSDSLTLTVHRMAPDGALTQRSSITIPMPVGAAPDASIDRLVTTEVNGQRIIVAISGNGNFVSTHLLADSGHLGPGAVHLSSQGLGYDQPSDVQIVQFGGQTYVIVAGGASSSLSVFRLDNTGRLTGTDHVIDELTTRFQSATALETVVVDGRAFVFVGGADDGITVFTLLPDGRLLHLTTIADSNTTTLADVSAIRAVAIDGRIMLFVTSATETGITQFTFDPGRIGATAIVGSGVRQGGSGGDLLVAGPGTTRLEGGAGNDILVAGASPITLTGGAGADTFVASRVQGRIIITDYEHGVDRLDLSLLGMIRSIWQLRFIPTTTGVMIVYGETVLDIYTRDGRSLSISDFSNASLFSVAHYLLPEVDPTRIRPEDTPSDTPEWLFGTEGPDLILGGPRPELIQAGGGQ